jgi:hypothetical protein
LIKKKYKDDGFGNKIESIKPSLDENGIFIKGTFYKGDWIFIHNKEGCRIATYQVK